MELLDIASLVIIGSLIAGVGTRVTAVVLGPKPWAPKDRVRRWFIATLPLQPVLVGAVIGCIPGTPAPAFMGDELVGRVVWGAVAGLFSSTAYDSLRGVLSKRRDDSETQS